MGLTSSQIILENNVFIAGGNVIGNLAFILNKPKKFRAIIIELHGKANTKVKERTTSNDGASSVVYFKDSEKIYYQCYILAGGQNNEVMLDAGNHIYPFSVPLPYNLPSSFKSKHGNIQYYVKARIDCSWLNSDSVKQEFVVHSPVDLNCNAEAKKPVRYEVIKPTGFFKETGRITLTVSLPQSGYIPNQKMPITIELDNTSSRHINSVAIKLVKVTKFKAKGRKKEIKDVLIDKCVDGVGPHSSKTSHCLPRIPPMAIINLEYCNIIKSHCFLKVKGKTSSIFSNDLNLTFPIYLGTEPIRQAVEIRPSAPAPPSPPPTYDELFSGQDHGRNYDCSAQFDASKFKC